MATQTQNLVAITGNTYPVKEQLKALGARWNGDQKAWMVTPEKADEAQRIVAGAGAKTLGARSSGFRPSRCRQCGCAASRYNPIYRSGDCKDCWVSDKEEADMGY
jgi:hypothetical protein